MNNIILIKEGKDWYLDVGIYPKEIPMTAEELWALHKVIGDRMDEIIAEIKENLLDQDKEEMRKV